MSTFVLSAGDAGTPMVALYQHLGWVRAAAESAINHGLYEHAELATCPITTWLHAHASELPEVETLLAEHETVHILGREILQVRQNGMRDEIHRLLGQSHGHSHFFQEGLGQAIKTMRKNAEAKAKTSSSERFGFVGNDSCVEPWGWRIASHRSRFIGHAPESPKRRLIQ